MQTEPIRHIEAGCGERGKASLDDRVLGQSGGFTSDLPQTAEHCDALRLRKVLELRRAIQDGTYQVSAEALAEALIRFAR